MKEYKYIFGPVPSRRLGYSLGIDVVPFKTCSYDCIYCQLGRTTDKTTVRQESFPLGKILNELKQKLEEAGTIDFVTLSGSGEPTLYLPLRELIEQVKRLTAIPVAVLTNGSLLWDEDVQKSLSKADLIIPSLDAGNEQLFRYVNRPCQDLTLQKVAEGIISFSSKYRDKIWLEVFLLYGVTALESEAEKINAIVKKIKPARVQLNTVVRPPAESFALTVPRERMKELAVCFDGSVEIIAEFNRPVDEQHHKAMKYEIISLLKRRPCSIKDISGSLNLHQNAVLKYLDELGEGDLITTAYCENILYFSIKQ